NDYVTKPFQMEELLARVRAHLRFHEQEREVEEVMGDVLQFGEITLNTQTREVYRNDDAIELTPREFDLLAYFLHNIKIVLNREQLLNNVWGYDYYGDTNVVDVYIRYLRNKIDKPNDVQYIHTVRRVGYEMKVD